MEPTKMSVGPLFIHREMDKEDVVHKYMVQMSLLTKQKLSHRLEKKLVVTRGKRWGEREG